MQTLLTKNASWYSAMILIVLFLITPFAPLLSSAAEAAAETVEVEVAEEPIIVKLEDVEELETEEGVQIIEEEVLKDVPVEEVVVETVEEILEIAAVDDAVDTITLETLGEAVEEIVDEEIHEALETVEESKEVVTPSPIEPIIEVSTEDIVLHVIISRIQTGGTSARDDAFTLSNFGENDVSLNGWSLRRCKTSGDDGEDCESKDGTSSIVTSDLRDVTIKSGEQFTWINESSSGKLSDNYAVALFDDGDNIVSALMWGDPSFTFIDAPRVANPSHCEVIIWDPKKEEYIIALQDREECQPIIYDGDIIYINELYPQPTEGEEEFVELFNPNDTTINLRGWSITDASATGKYTFTGDFFVEPLDYATLFQSTLGFALNNSGGETVTLIAPDTSVVDVVTYETATPRASYSRHTSAETPFSWSFIVTPGEENKFHNIGTFPELIISEILPNPLGDESLEEYIEIYNPTAEPVSLLYWTLRDASATGAYTFFDDVLIQPKEYLVVKRDVFDFALNNSGSETVLLIAPNDVVTSTLSYETARGGASLGFTGVKYRWSRTQTPGGANIFGEELRVEGIEIGDTFKNVPTEFDVRFNVPEDTASVRWEFGDERRSYLKETRHVYEEKGVYYGTVRVSNDIEEVTQNFTITVEKYPRYDVKIIELMPNPEGKDTENEYIILQNDEKGKINLTGWSIATGKDDNSLVNHPIREEVKIKKDKTAKITHVESAISLNNTAGIIELRRPDGSIADNVSYSSLRDTSIPDNAVYRLTENTWRWIIPPSKSKSQVNIRDFIQQAWRNTYAIDTSPRISPSAELRARTSIENLSHILNALSHILILHMHSFVPEESQHIISFPPFPHK